MNTDLCAFEAIHPLGDSATGPLARLVGRPALSLLLAGMSLLRPHMDIDPCCAGTISSLRVGHPAQTHHLPRPTEVSRFNEPPDAEPYTLSERATG
ncbi:MAG: hypothetical protein Q8N89_16900 [Azonexus sp.]|nr:hypothetical protein [Azonexus sp.]